MGVVATMYSVGRARSLSVGSGLIATQPAVAEGVPIGDRSAAAGAPLVVRWCRV